MTKVNVETTVDLSLISTDDIYKQALKNLKSSKKGWKEFKEKFPEKMAQERKQKLYKKHLSVLEAFKKVINE